MNSARLMKIPFKSLLSICACGLITFPITFCSSGGSSSDDTNGTTNKRPVAEVQLDKNQGYVPPDFNVNADISGSYDPDGEIVSYRLDCDSNNGLDYENSGDNLNDLITCTYKTEGNREITLEVTDNNNAKDTATSSINVGSGAPQITLVDYPTSPQETNNPLLYEAQVTDPNNNLSKVDFSVSGNTVSPSQSGDNYLISYPPEDGQILNVGVYAVDTTNLVSTKSFPDITVYLSEQDGQDAILNSFPDLNTVPSTVVDEIHDFYNPYQIDVVALFRHPDEGVKIDKGLKHKDADYYTTQCKVPFEYFSMDNTADGGMNSSELSDLENELAAYPYCGSAKLSGEGPYRFFNYEENGMPLSKSDINAAVSSVLSYEDVNINYRPVADAIACDSSSFCGENILVGGGETVTLDGTNSYDVDGPYTCEWDAGDGTYPQQCKVDILYGEGCYYAKLRVKDDENAEDTDTVKIDVGGNCP